MAYLRNEKVIKLLGEKIREVRLSKGISLENLAFDANMEYSQIARIELGKINTSVSHLFSIATALNVKATELIDFDL